ncbi:MAG: Hpt domain-containing protein [Eubacterium sp.]|nr:Hpt domain-containing protein [Eubacterium sp.]
MALKNNNLDEGFEIAHSLKGVLGNLSLTPLYDIMVEITSCFAAEHKWTIRRIWKKQSQ